MKTKQIYNMDIGWGQPAYTCTPEQQAVLDGIYAMMDPDRGAELPFDVFLSELEFDGVETVTVLATAMHRRSFVIYNVETVSFTLGELFK